MLISLSWPVAVRPILDGDTLISTTHNVFYFVAGASLVVGASLLLRRRTMRVAVLAALCVVLAALASGLARSHPADYVARSYGGALGFAARAGFSRVLTYGLPAGAAIVVDPTIQAFDGNDWGTCEQARDLDAVIAIGPHPPRILDCGRTIYRDARTSVLDPRGAPGAAPARASRRRPVRRKD